MILWTSHIKASRYGHREFMSKTRQMLRLRTPTAQHISSEILARTSSSQLWKQRRGNRIQEFVEMPCAGNRIAIAIASTGLQESSYVTRTIATRALEHFQHGQLQPVSRYAPQAKNVFFYVKKSKGDVVDVWKSAGSAGWDGSDCSDG